MKRFSSTSVFNNRGFTLIEILISITLLAFIAIGVVSITQNAADTKDRTTEINKNNLMIETALSRLEWDFSQIYSPLYFSIVKTLNVGDQDGDGLDDQTQKPVSSVPATPLTPEQMEYNQLLIQRFEGNEHFFAVSKEGLPIPRFYSPEKSTFEFFTSSNRRKIQNTRQSHFAWVRYALGEAISRPDAEPNPAIPPSLKTLVRYFSANDPYDDKRLDPSDETRVKGAVLLENVESLEFQFWNPQNRKWETNLKTIQGGESLLRGLKILIVWYDTMGIKRNAERIYRNHWPMEVPKDTIAPGTTAGVAAGATAGTTAGTTAGAAAGTSAGTTAGAAAGVNSGSGF
jgi:prepilin-type N-terminal cleavage/methylation domain-containing protein